MHPAPLWEPSAHGGLAGAAEPHLLLNMPIASASLRPGSQNPAEVADLAILSSVFNDIPLIRAYEPSAW